MAITGWHNRSKAKASICILEDWKDPKYQATVTQYFKDYCSNATTTTDAEMKVKTSPDVETAVAHSHLDGIIPDGPMANWGLFTVLGESDDRSKCAVHPFSDEPLESNQS